MNEILQQKKLVILKKLAYQKPKSLGIFICFLVLLSTFSFRAFAQESTVTGIVRDSTGRTLPGVTVQVKDGSAGTITDQRGVYAINIRAANSVLRFSFVGYITQDEAVNNQKTLNVILHPDQRNLNEVVVVGYGTSKKGDLTGAITVVKPSDLNQGSANLNVAQMLDGRVAGLTINQHSQDPGADPQILIRGDGTLDIATTTRPNANNPNPLYNPLIGNSADPLVLVDGFPISKMRDLDAIPPDEIESITILKDASSTAIYGTRGANGVIIITTKKGKTSKMTIGYNVQIATDFGAKQVPVLNASQYLNFYEQLGADPNNKLSPPAFPYTQAQVDSISKLGAGTNWQSVVARKASTLNQEHELSLSGHNGFITYSLDGSYFDQFGNIAPLQYTREYGKSKLGYDDGKFSFDVSLSYTHEKDDQRTDDYWGAITSDPAQPVYNANGNLSVNPFPNQQGRSNPLFLPTESSNFWIQGTSFVGAAAKYIIVPGLSVNTNLGVTKYDYQQFFNQMATWTTTGSVDPTQNNANASYRSFGNNIAELFANYTKTVATKNVFSLLAGGSLQSRFYRDIFGQGTDFANPNIGYYSLLGSTTVSQPSTSYYTSESQSAFGRLNYGYDDKYLATFNFRADGATQFGPDHKIGYFPSGAVAWRIDKEDFMKSVTAIKNLKLRVGYGVAGNDNIPSGLTDLNYQYGSYAGGTTLTRVGNYVPNPNLEWERVKTLNFGLDFGVKNLSITTDYYIKNSDQLLLQKNVPVETGYSIILVNQGKVQNKGVETTISLYVPNILGSGISYSPSFNFAYNNDMIVNLGGEVVQTNYIFIGNTQYPYTIQREAGHQYNSFYLFHYEGVWQQNEAAEAAKYGAVPGDPKFRDANGDGKLTDADRYWAGNGDPDITFGFANKFNYKQFELDAFVQGVYGNKVYSQTQLILDNPSAGYFNNLSPDVLDRWTPTNPSNTEDSKLKPLSQELAASDKYLEDGSFLRLKEVVFSYSLPKDIIHGINTIKVGLGMTNIFTITKFKGLNPDVQITDSQYNLYPFNHTLTLNLNVNF